MQVWFRSGLVAAVLAMVACSPAMATVRYVSNAGNDAWDGLAATRKAGHGPWRSLARVAGAQLQAGDRVLLRCGDTWREQLKLGMSGTPAAPITLGSYGTGNRPAILGPGTGGTACVTLDKSAGWAIRGLELANAQNAVRIVPDSRVRTDYDNITIEDCYLHDIANPAFPDTLKREGSRHEHLRNMGYAIMVDGADSPGPVKLRNLTVRRNVALWCQGFYMHAMGPIGAEDLLFDANTLSHISYNAIYHTGGRQFSVKRSVFVYCYPWNFHPNGATQVLAGGLDGDANDRNDVIGNEMGWGGDYPGCPDGCAYDFEGATSGVTFRNNFIHNTSGEAVLFMGGFQQKDLVFDHNTFRTCVLWSPRWNRYVTVTNSNTGSGVFSNNRFYIQPGKQAFTDKPACYTFVNNDENAQGGITAMPLVTSIVAKPGRRTYALACLTPGAVIRYTLDGSVPTPTSPVYKAPITLARSGALNAKAFKDGLDPSYINSLVVDLRDREGKADRPVATTADHFTLAFRADLKAERVPGSEALQLHTTPMGGESTVVVDVGTNGASVYEQSGNDRTCLLNVDLPLPGSHHFAVVFRNKQPALYVDGVYQKAGCTSRRVVHPVVALAGTTGAAQVFGRVLTDAEIQQLAAPGSGGRLAGDRW